MGWAPACAGARRERGTIPKIISIAQEIAYLRTLAETGNATLAAEVAGVSKSWAYKKRGVDPQFDGWSRLAVAVARARLPVRVNRDRAGGWTARTEQHFLAVLSATRRLVLAAAAVGKRPGSAYNRRRRRSGFAADCARVAREGDEWLEGEWLESAACLFEGEPLPAVRRVTIAEMIRAVTLRR
jgi:hypothetical protein